jgi:hypothetical protein
MYQCINLFLSYTTIYIKLTHLRVIIYWQHVSVALCDHHRASLTQCVPSLRVQYGILYVFQTVLLKLLLKLFTILDKIPYDIKYINL